MTDFVSPEIKATDQYQCAMGDKDACARLVAKANGQYAAQILQAYKCASKQNKDECVKAAIVAAGGSNVEKALQAYDCASKQDKDTCIRAAIKASAGENAEQVLQAYECASKEDKDACVKSAIRAAGGDYVDQELQAYECAKHGDSDECKKLVLTMAAQAACTATGPAALACRYVAPFLVKTIYPYIKGFVNGILGAPGVFLSDIGINLSGIMAQGVFSPSIQSGQLSPAVVAQWTQAVAGVEAVWHAARLQAGLPDAPVAIDPKLVAESATKVNELSGWFTSGDDAAGPMSRKAVVRTKSLSARQALLAWLYAYAAGWNKRLIFTLDQSYLNGQAQVWTVPQSVPAFAGEPEDAGMIRGPLAVGPDEAYDGDRGGWPKKCNSDCVQAHAIACGWAWKSRLDALALAMIAMTQVIAKQVLLEQETQAKGKGDLGSARSKLDGTIGKAGLPDKQGRPVSVAAIATASVATVAAGAGAGYLAIKLIKLLFGR